MLVEQATRKAKDDINKVKETMKAVCKPGIDEKTQELFQKELKVKTDALKDAKQKIEDKIDLAQAKRIIKRLEDKINRIKTSGNPNLRTLDRLTKRREWWITKQEEIRIKEEKRMKAKEQCYLKDKSKLEERVKYCELHPKATGCDYFLARFKKDVQVLQTLKKQETKVEADIAKSREKHIQTFKNNNNVEAKKAIIDTKYNTIILRLEKRIQKLSRKLKELKDQPNSNRDKESEDRLEKRIEKLKKHLEKLKLEKDKTQVIQSTGPGHCNSCEQRIMDILNKLYALMMEEHSQRMRRQSSASEQKIIEVKSTKTTADETVSRKIDADEDKKTKESRSDRSEKKVQKSEKEEERGSRNRSEKKNLITKHREVKKKVPFEDWKWVNEKVLVNKPKRVRKQELVATKNGDMKWKDLGYEDTTEPVWETQRKRVKFTNYKEVTVSEPYQEWVIQKEESSNQENESRNRKGRAESKSSMGKLEKQISEDLKDPQLREEKERRRRRRNNLSA